MSENHEVNENAYVVKHIEEVVEEIEPVIVKEVIVKEVKVVEHTEEQLKEIERKVKEIVEPVVEPTEVKEEVVKEEVKLTENKVLNSAIKKLVDDEEFIKSLDERIKEITRDGKIDSKDIPDLMLIVLECSDNLGKFDLTYDEILQILEEFIMYILETRNLIEEKDKESIEKLLRTVLKLTMARPQIKSWFKTMWKKIKAKFNC